VSNEDNGYNTIKIVSDFKKPGLSLKDNKAMEEPVPPSPPIIIENRSATPVKNSEVKENKDLKEIKDLTVLR